MKNLLHFLYMMTKFSIYGLIIQCILFNAIFAGNSNAQIKSVKEITVDLEVKQIKVKKALKLIEDQTDYSFVFTDEEINKNERVTVYAKNAILADVLKEISKQARLQFKQVNQNISVKHIPKNKIPEDNNVQVFIQARNITGKVTAEDAPEGLPGVNVILQGTSQGTVTDIDGNYTIDVPSEEAVLVFSSVGYVKQEVTVGNQQVININMLPDVTALEEIVVVGYGTQEKKEITSAVSSVKSEDFNVGNVQSPAQLIQGKVAGLTVTRAGGDPNGGFNIRMRGVSTLGENTEPLVVIDGVIGGSMKNLDPNDIESIDVLKDGSAAAIYGTRGSSGVILVTTKQGKAGQMRVNYNGYVNADMPYRFIDVMNASQWRDLSAEINAGEDFGADTDWFDEITRTGTSHVHNLGISGGSEQTTYRVSLNYRDIEGVALNTGFERLNARLNLNHRALNDKLSLTLNIGGTYDEQERGFGEAFKQATIYNPTAPVKSNDPEYEQYGGYFQQVLFDYKNPVAILEQNVNDGLDKTLNISGRAAYDLLDNLTIDAFYSIQDESEERSRYFSKQSFWIGMDRDGNAIKTLDTRFNQLFESTLSYNGSLSNGTLDAVAGYSFQEFTNEGFGMRGGNFIIDNFTYNNMGTAKEFQDGLADVMSYKNSHKLVAFFGRINFAWDQTYFLSASGRYEGSSRFGSENKWGFFPGISAGVELANFIDNATVSSLKLRASYGVTGSIPGESYISLLRYGQGEDFLFEGDYVPSYGPVQNPNPDLKWEKKAETNIGIDYSLLDGKLYGAVDYYQRKTTDLIQERAVPSPPNLFDLKWVNIGEIQNNGLEFLINYKAVNNEDFSYTPSITYTYYLKNELVSLSNADKGFEFGVEDIANLGSPGQNETPLIRVEEGKEIGQIWGLVYEGIAEDGSWIHKDVNDDGEITTADRQVIGHGLPDFELGFANSLRYKNWDASVFFRGVFGHDLVNTFRAFYEVPQAITSYNVMASSADLRNPNTGTLLNTSSGKFSSLHVEDASYVRLDNMSIGYNFSLPEASAFRTIRVYVSANNLFVITDYSGSDPEVRYQDKNPEDDEFDIGLLDFNEEGGDVLAPGIDRRNTWFMTRSFSLGVNIGF